MNKSKSIVKIVIWSVLAFLLIGILIGVIILGKNDMGFMIGTSGYKYENPDSYTVGDAILTDTVTSAEITWISGEINIIAYDGDKIVINETEVKNDDYKMRYKVHNGRLIIHYEKSGRGFGLFINQPEKDLTVNIPRTMAEALKEIEIEATSADVNISMVKTDLLEIENVSGKINLDMVDARNLDISSVSGNTLANGSYLNIEAESVSGMFNLKSKTPLKKAEFDSTSGNIELYMPETGFTAEVDSVSGEFNTEFSTVKKGNKYTSGDGSSSYEFETVSGDITIKKLN